MIGHLLLGLLLGCTPDETGYGDTDLGVSEDGRDDMGTEAPAAGAPGVTYTAQQTLGSSPVAVTVLALPGTFAGREPVVVAVTGRGPGLSVEIVDGGFVAVVSAALDDVVNVVDGDSVLASVLLADDLAPLETAEANDGAVPDAGPLGVAVGASGLDVGDGALPGFVPPYVAYNAAAAGAVRRVDRGDTDVVLPAVAGDEVCVAPEVAGRLRVSTCFSAE
jgi:hypothetical protein